MSTISGRRKEATAVVKLTKGTGMVTVNKKNIDDYFGRDVAKMIVRQPLVLTKNDSACLYMFSFTSNVWIFKSWCFIWGNIIFS